MLKHRPEVQTTPAAYSITEFCKAYRLSRSGFYKLLAQNKGPKTTQIGKRRLIGVQDAADWFASFSAN